MRAGVLWGCTSGLTSADRQPRGVAAGCPGVGHGNGQLPACRRGRSCPHDVECQRLLQIARPECRGQVQCTIVIDRGNPHLNLDSTMWVSRVGTKCRCHACIRLAVMAYGNHVPRVIPVVRASPQVIRHQPRILQGSEHTA